MVSQNKKLKYIQVTNENLEIAYNLGWIKHSKCVGETAENNRKISKHEKIQLR